MTNSTKYFIGGFILLLITVVIMMGVKYHQDHPNLFTEPNYKPYQDSIIMYKKNFNLLQHKEDSLAHVDSALTIVKNQITQQYYEKVKHIKLASTHQLDSIIRSELGHNSNIH